MDTRTVDLHTPDGTMPLYEARPDDARGAVVVIQEAFGVNEYIESVVRRLADAGWHGVAPHVFHRAGGGTVQYGDWDGVLKKLEGLSDDGFLMDVDAAIEHLGRAGWEDGKIGAVGFCMGGRVSFLVAARRALGAAVGFYGGGIVTSRVPQLPSLIDEVPTLKTPWLGLFGDLDESIPVDDVERLRAELDDKATVAHDVVRYADAGHGFHCDLRDAYVPGAAKDAWQRALDWFDEHLA